MVPTRIARYFQNDLALQALHEGIDFAESRGWLLSDRASLYKIATHAFAQPPSLSSFEELFNGLKRWQIARGGGLATPDQIYELLVNGCSGCSRHLCNSPENMTLNLVQSPIAVMASIKSNREYPHMAASKFLHFYNPHTFPIYDDAVIWKDVLRGSFRSEWAEICRAFGIKTFESSQMFLITYTLLAYECINFIGRDTMSSFNDRFNRGTASPIDVQAYYASAFEYILIGAAKIESH